MWTSRLTKGWQNNKLVSALQVPRNSESIFFWECQLLNAAVSKQYFISDLSRSKYHQNINRAFCQSWGWMAMGKHLALQSSGGLCLTDPPAICDPHFWFQFQDHSSSHSNVPGAFNSWASPEFYPASLKSVFCGLLCQLLLFRNFPVDFPSMISSPIVHSLWTLLFLFLYLHYYVIILDSKDITRYIIQP